MWLRKNPWILQHSRTISGARSLTTWFPPHSCSWMRSRWTKIRRSTGRSFRSLQGGRRKRRMWSPPRRWRRKSARHLPGYWGLIMWGLWTASLNSVGHPLPLQACSLMPSAEATGLYIRMFLTILRQGSSRMWLPARNGQKNRDRQRNMTMIKLIASSRTMPWNTWMKSHQSPWGMWYSPVPRASWASMCLQHSWQKQRAGYTAWCGKTGQKPWKPVWWA